MQDIVTTLSTSKPASLTPAEPQPRSRDFVANLFARLQASLGAKLADVYQGAVAETVQEEWAHGLADFDREEIQRGVRACRTREFAPNLGEFMRLCRPALDPEVAWFEAAEGLKARRAGRIGAWSHPAVFRAACVMHNEIRSGEYRPVRKRWEWTLQREFARGRGAPVPEPVIAIPEETVHKAAPMPEAFRQQLEIIRSSSAVAAARRKAVTRPIAPQEDALSALLSPVDWKASTPEVRVELLGEPFRSVRVLECIAGTPVAIVIEIGGRRYMLVGDLAGLAAELAAVIAKRAAEALERP